MSQSALAGRAARRFDARLGASIASQRAVSGHGSWGDLSPDHSSGRLRIPGAVFYAPLYGLEVRQRPRSIEVRFGRPGFENNSIPTVPGKNWFAYFRFYLS